MAITADLTCPSKAVFRIKSLTGSSIDKLVEYTSDKNRKFRSEAGYMYLMLKEAVVEVLDQGPYSSKTLKCGQGGLVDPSGLLVGDITYILAYVRLVTVGPEMVFEHSCPSCKHKSTPVANLENIVGQTYSEEAITAFSQGVATVTRVDGLKVGITPATGATLEYQSKLRTDSTARGFSLTQASMVSSVEGLQENDRASIADWIRGLDFISLGELEEATKALDGGIEFEMHITCSECGQESEAVVPLIRPLEAKEAKRPMNTEFLRSNRGSGHSLVFSASQLKKPTGASS